MKTLSILGLGTMAEAILSGLRKNPDFETLKVKVLDIDRAKMEDFKHRFLAEPADSLEHLVEKSDVLLLAVKPQHLSQVLPELKALDTPPCIWTIAAAKNLDFYESYLGSNQAIIRFMPNINAKVQASCTAMASNSQVTEAQKIFARSAFESIGSLYELSETSFPVFSAIAGSSGAFVYLYLDALARAGVTEGLPRALSEAIAIDTVKGSAQLLQSSSDHPIALVDAVCSPGGTTIRGIQKLKEKGFESAIFEGISAIIKRDYDLSNS